MGNDDVRYAEVVDELRRSASELDSLLGRTSTALTRLTDCLSIVLAPSVLNLHIKQLSLVSLNPHRALVVLVTEDGQVFKPSDGVRRRGGRRGSRAGSAFPGRCVHRQDAARDRGRPRRGDGGGVSRPSRSHGARRSAVLPPGKLIVAGATARGVLASHEARVQPVPSSAAGHASARGRYRAAAHSRRRGCRRGGAHGSHRSGERSGGAGGRVRGRQPLRPG